MDDFTIYGILYACPAGIRTEECLIKAIDHKTFQDKINWVDGLRREKKSHSSKTSVLFIEAIQ